MAFDPTQLLSLLSSQGANAGQSIGGLMSLLANLGRYNQGQGQIDQFNQGPGADWRTFLGDAAGKYNPGGSLDPAAMSNTLTGNANSMFDTLLPQYKQRWTDAMAHLNGSGAQERTDINANFNNQKSGAVADLTSRGLGGTTATTGAQGAIERGRSDALGGLNQRLNDQWINTNSQLSGDYLNAYQGLWGNKVNAALQGYNIGQTGLNNQTNLLQNLYGANSDQLFTNLNWLTGQVNPYPNQGTNLQLQQSLGSGMAPSVHYPSQSSGSGFGMGLAQGGIGAAGTVGTLGLVGAFS